jgi:predicted O-linked N-acetylglucosamine transferase (SPINDLY family)
MLKLLVRWLYRRYASRFANQGDLRSAVFTPSPPARPAMQMPPTQSTESPALAKTLEQVFNNSRQGDPAQAERPGELLLQAGGESFDALHLMGVLGARQGKVDEAIGIIIGALRRNPGSAEAHALLTVCAWSQLKQVIETLRERITKGKSGEISPLGLLPLPETNASEQYLCARQYAEHQYGEFLSRPPLCGTELRAAQERLRIGYLSADYHEHPVSHLVAEVIERHDRGRFQVFGYSYGPDSEDPMRKRMRAAFDAFREVRSLSHEAAARQILDDRIDILVDLTGYTTDTRLEILALRPAPVQVSWLGYPGTLGHPRLADYIIGDPIVSPIAHAAHYSEALALMPHCFQPNDRQRAVGAAPQRAAAGLPAHGFIFCCFNQSYKITSAMFDLWCRLLTEVPGSVLWLLGESAAVQRNFQREAQQRGVMPERIIFAPRVDYAEHLARFQLAGLFLDTLPFNAGATASDALWAGLPLVTCTGETFAGRMAGSLLNAAGLPELITHSLREYEALALKLATDSKLLAGTKAKLARDRDTCPLFDSERITRDLERLLCRMATDHRAGSRQHIVIGADDVR